MSTRSAIEVRPDERDFAQLMRDIRGFDKELAKALKRRLREAGDPAVQSVRQRVLSAPSHSNTGLRAGLARSVKLSVRATGISIRSTGAGLPAGKQAMVRAYDKASFSHPVFGHPGTSVSQRGREYFDQPLEQRAQAFRAKADVALADAARTIRAAEVSS